MKNKKYWLVAVIALALAAGLLILYFATRPSTAAGAKTFTVTVVHADGTSKDFTYTTDQEYLGAVLQAEGLIQGDMGDYGLYINTVDGETADYDKDQSYWSLYIGDEYAQQGIDQTPVHDGDTFRLEYTVYTEE